MEQEDFIGLGVIGILGIILLISVSVLSYRTGRNAERSALTQALKDQTEAIMQDGYKICVDDLKGTEQSRNQFWYNKGVKDTLKEQDDAR